MDERIDRKAVSIGSSEDQEKEDIRYWAEADATEKFTTITYLRECFYGPEATTGRLQRVYTVLKRS
ncbi:MAG: hypothetical protein KAH54_04140 [Candidatus Sabulitectum sp.]|nr:hypothetical protein [Candidatus Sabulitectum sp.]